ncbi:MAG: cobalamin B12-binding domain-containing protein [Phycisphaerales bacterium]
MSQGNMIERFFETLVTGNRPAARQLVDEALQTLSPEQVVGELFWPTYEQMDKLYRADQLTALAHHMGTRLLRVLIDQNSTRYNFAPSNGRTILAFCGATEADEMGAQMAVDTLEVAGFQVSFAGGGIANDEILAQVNETQPDVLLMFASSPSDLPNIRALIDTIKEIDACTNLQFAVGAGVFNRADGLAEEIGADLWASDPMELAERLIEEPMRRADAEQRTVGKSRRKRLAA